LTAWLALTASTPETGCLRVLPGSHKAAVPHEVRNAPSSMLPLGEEVSLEIDMQNALPCPLRPGEMSLHHMMLIHGSAANASSTERRIGFAIRYIAGDARQRGGEMGYATLVRGCDHLTFQLESRPHSVLEPGALRRHRQILAHSARLVILEAGKLGRQAG
jgi:ectoine hydroxylase-related dioxygenase (phytanoyl-CoA dioxygenase family)